MARVSRIELQLRDVLASARRPRRRRTKRIVALDPGLEPIPIARLVSPLRYDILVRRDFFEFLGSHLPLFTADRWTFDTLLERHPYFIWFRHVNCEHHHRQWLQTPERFHEALTTRVDRNRVLYESLLERGFSNEDPIKLTTADVVRRTNTGKSVRPRLLVADGSHRVGLLMLLGQDALQPGQYVIHHRPEIRPLDNTGLLLRHLDVPDSRYYEFLSWGYLDSSVTDGRELLDELRALGPDVVEEVRQLMRVDGRDPM